MNFKISKNIFSNALQISTRAVSPNSPIPALVGISIIINKDNLILISSDSDISIKVELSNAIDDKTQLEVNETGELVIDYRIITEIVRKIDSDIINFELIDDRYIRIFGELTEYKINTIDPKQYPQIQFKEINDVIKINSDILKSVIEQTFFATSDTETRPVLTGVNFKYQNQTLKCVATDSFRLAQKSIALNEDYDFNITIPKKSLVEINHTLKEDQEVILKVENNSAQFIIDNILIQTRLIEGDYPDTDRLLPTNFDYELVIKSKELRDAIDRTSFIKTEGTNIIKLNLEEDKVSLKSESNEVGSSFQNLNIISYTGDKLNIACSGKYVKEALKSLNSDTVKIQFKGEMKPFIFTSEENIDNIELVLPIRTY